MSLAELISPNGFIGQAIWALLFLSLLTAPMGCFMVWRKLSYFGATLSHSALLGAIAGIITGIGVLAGVIGFTVVLAVALSFWLNHRKLAGDTILGMIAHLTLAIGVIGVSLMDNLRIDLMAYLFGDVLSISQNMFYVSALLSCLGLTVIVVCWKGFINITVQSDIARVEGFATQRLELIFTLVLALTIALGMLSIGVLLIISILIIPAATARLLATSLKSMVLITWVLTVFAVVSGMLSAYWLDFPAGPTIVVMSGLCFFVVYTGLKALSSK